MHYKLHEKEVYTHNYNADNPAGCVQFMCPQVLFQPSGQGDKGI